MVYRAWEPRGVRSISVLFNQHKLALIEREWAPACHGRARPGGDPPGIGGRAPSVSRVRRWLADAHIPAHMYKREHAQAQRSHK